MRRFNLLHKSNFDQLKVFFVGGGCRWIDLPDGWMFIAGDFGNPSLEHQWNSNPAVVHLHHPENERKLTLGDLLKPEHAYKRFTAEHLEMLKSVFGATEADTIHSLNLKVWIIHPYCAIFRIPRQRHPWIN